MIGLELVRGLRRLRRAPRYSLAVILSSALAVGPTLIAFSLFSAVFLQKPAAKAAERLYAIQSGRTVRGSPSVRGVSFPDFEDLRAGLPRDAWSYSTAWTIRELSLSTASSEQSVRVAAISGEYFQIANAHLVRGAFPREAEQAAVVTQRLARELAAAGEADQLTLLGQRFRVVGVVDEQFRGIDPRDGVDAWIPLTALPRLDDSPDLLTYRELENLSVLVETRDAVQAAPLQASTQMLSGRLAQFHASDHQGWHLAIAPAQPSLGKVLQTRAGQVAIAPLVVVLCVLLIAATNIANLAGVRAAGREREAQLWLTMGMPRWRLLLLECGEPFVLSVVGGAVGIAAGVVGLRYVAALPVVERFGLRLDSIAIIGAGISTALFGVLCALMPALRIRRLEERDVVHQGQGITSRGVSGLQRVYLVLQFTVALAFTGTALQLAHAVQQQSAVDVGFNTDRLLVVTGLAGAPRRTPEEWAQDYERVARAVTTVPGVTSVAGSVAEPFGGYAMSKRPLSTTPSSSAADNAIVAAMDVVSPGYFSTLGLRVLKGREFALETSSGASARTILVNESMARRIAGTGSALGRTIFEQGQYPLEIVGVVPDVRATASDAAEPVYYRSLAQSPLPSFVLYARVTAPSRATMQAITASIMRALPESAGRLRIQSAETQRQTRDAPAILVFGMSVGLAGIAMLITALGLYGVAAHVTVSKSKEYGIRAALGASPGRLAATVFRDGLQWTAVAAVLSLPSIWIGTTVATALVVGARPVPLGTALGLLCTYGIVVFVTLLGPAHRAASESPATALRAF